MYRTLLVHVDRDAASFERSKLAVDLARQHGAVLVGLTAGLPRLPVEMYSDGFGVFAAGRDFTELDRKELEAEFGRAVAQFREVTKDSGLTTAWRSSFEFPSDAIVAASASADLIIAGPGDRSLLGDYRLASAGDVLMRCGRPMLVVPAGIDRLDVRNVVAGWKNTREARRALADAVPLLKNAARVHLLHIGEGQGGAQSAKDAQAFLEGHQIKATFEVMPHDEPIEAKFIESAERMSADLIVAGAYGHTRLREWVFGGMTRGLLGNCPIPLLMSH
jgi:nucleotide-binding universal stress UspA family protein